MVWRQGWRGMHHPQQAQITAEFLVEGAGAAVLQRTWSDGLISLTPRCTCSSAARRGPAWSS